MADSPHKGWVRSDYIKVGDVSKSHSFVKIARANCLGYMCKNRCLRRERLTAWECLGNARNARMSFAFTLALRVSASPILMFNADFRHYPAGAIVWRGGSRDLWKTG
jgi:hypothetical protein